MRTLVRLASEGRPVRAIEVGRALDALVASCPTTGLTAEAVHSLADVEPAYGAALWAEHVFRLHSRELGSARPYALGDVSASLLGPLGIEAGVQARYQRAAFRRLFPVAEPKLHDDSRLAELLALAGLRRGNPIAHHLHGVALRHVWAGELDAARTASDAVAALIRETAACRERERRWLVDATAIERSRWVGGPWQGIWARAARGQAKLGPLGRERLFDLIFDGQPLEAALGVASELKC